MKLLTFNLKNEPNKLRTGGQPHASAPFFFWKRLQRASTFMDQRLTRSKGGSNRIRPYDAPNDQGNRCTQVAHLIFPALLV